MAMKDSSPSSPDWMQIYHQSITEEIQPLPASNTSSRATEASLSSQTISAVVSNNLKVKNSSRKSRTSKKPPTMIVNTDVTNFRVLVQQFTGIDSVPMINHHQKYEVQHQQHQQHQQLQLKQQGTLFNDTSDLLVQQGFYLDGMYATSNDNRNDGYGLGVVDL